MKLIDLLVKVLPSKCGWPDSAEGVVQDWNYGTIFFFTGCTPLSGFNGKEWTNAGRWVRSIECQEIAEDCSTALVTRAQYESALAALTEIAPQQVQSLAWDGSGRPPEGTECEVKSGRNSYTLCKIVHSSDAGVAFVYLDDERYKGILDCLSRDGVENNFRPIRNEAERRRENIRRQLAGAICGDIPDVGMAPAYNYATRAFDAIAAGKIPGIKLED